MPRKANTSRVPYTTLTRVASTFNKSLRIIHSETAKKPSKIVVGDQSGNVTCFKWKKETQITFQHIKNEAITALALDHEDQIIIAHGQTIERIKKKGRILSVFNLSLNEDITSVQSRDDTVWCCGQYVYHCYKNEKDSHFFMSNDIINDMILIDLQLDELCPVLACKDKAIRVLKGSELLFQIETESNVTSLHEILLNPSNPEQATHSSNRQIIYGLENGAVGQLLLDSSEFSKGWLINDKDEGAVNCLSSYDFTKDGFPEVIVGRDNGVIDVYEWRPEQKPYILASECLNESITSVDTGYVTGETDQDIVAATYSGKIIAFHCDPSRDFAAWEETAINHNGSTGLASPLKKQMKKSQVQDLCENLRDEITNLEREIAHKKSKYQEKSKELIAVNRQFNLKHSLKLLESEAAYFLTLEIGIAVDFVAVHSTTELVSLDIDAHFGLQTQHKQINVDVDTKESDYADAAEQKMKQVDNNSNHCFVFHVSSTETQTRFTWKFRVNEGEQGTLSAFIGSARIPKTAQFCQFPIKALSLHSAVQIHDDSEKDAMFKDRPVNVLTMNGDWSLRTFVSWISQCIPDVPSRVSHQSDELVLAWKSLFVGDYILAHFRNGTAVFKSDSVTNIAILQQFLNKLAIENNVAMSSVNVHVDVGSALHFFDLVREKLEYHDKIHKQHSWINALKEIESHEDDNVLATCLTSNMQHILKGSEEIIDAFKTSPKHLQFIKNMIWENIQSFVKLRNRTMSNKHVQQLQRSLSQCDCAQIIAVTKEIMK